MGLSLHLQMERPSTQMHLKYGDDIIVGILDTGTSSNEFHILAYPAVPSFTSAHMKSRVSSCMFLLKKKMQLPCQQMWFQTEMQQERTELKVKIKIISWMLACLTKIRSYQYYSHALAFQRT
jgi:hypothetical protein